MAAKAKSSAKSKKAEAPVKPMNPTSKKGRVCPDCKGTQFTEDSMRGELVCSKCGLVMQQDIIDTGQEWRAFDSEQMSIYATYQ